MKMVFRIGNSHVTVEDGIILAVERNNSTFCKDDDGFVNSLLYVFVYAVDNHPNKLATLIKNLSPSKDENAKNALMALKDCYVPDEVAKAVAIALGEKTETAVTV